MNKNILWFKDIGSQDINLAGGKGANLGEMFNSNIPVPNGFVVTSNAYFSFIKNNKLENQIRRILGSLDINKPEQLDEASKNIKKIIKTSPMPPETAKEIMLAYKKMSSFVGLKNIAVAVRSSATAEDLPDASFAGQQETFLNVTGEANVIKRVQDCWASLFTPRAIFYRENKKFDHLKVGIAVPIQKMVNSDISGIAFSINPITNDKNQIIIETIWGLGEYIVQGTVTPDQHIVNKTNWKVESSKINPQKIQLSRTKNETKETKVPKYKINKSKISNQIAIKIAKIVNQLQNHYRKPQDVEFALEKNKK